MNSLVNVKNLGFAYNKNAIIEDMSFDVSAGSFLAIAGPNGAGKTTLLNLVCGILKPDSGQITIDSVPIKNYSYKNLARKIAVVRQEFIPSFDFTVSDTVSMARTPYLGILGF
ncbi:MAG: ABC transporter ATP-binding protein, partial [Phycisphaerae bacterium]